MADKKPTFTIDGREFEIEPGKTVIQYAHEDGIEVPHYCYHPGLSIAGNCRICMVEVEGWNKPVVACKQLPSPGMAVRTESEFAKAAQAGTMEMLLVNHPLDCPICDQVGECHLQDYSYEHGAGKAVATTQKTKLPKNVPFGEKIVYDAERCIKCTLCIRFCEEITHTNELNLGGRGDEEVVIMTSKGEFETPYSMNIIDICPVGALTSRDFRFKSRLWFMDFAPSIDTSCARGTNITTGGRDGTFLRIEPRYNADVNQWWMPDAARLGYAFVNSPTRVRTPLLRASDGRLRPAGWDAAIVAAAVALREAPGDVLLDGGATLEEMAVAQDLAAAIDTSAKFAAAVGEDDGWLVVAEKGANAKGAEMLGIARAKRAAPAAMLLIEREEHVNASMREKSGATVVFALDAEQVPASARVVFPMPSWAERDGLLVNCDGIVQAMQRNPGIGPPDLMAPVELLEEILGELDDGYDWRGRDGVIVSIRARSEFAGVPFPVDEPRAAEVGA
jgi:NADH-quinone oxidoreductase subunit G